MMLTRQREHSRRYQQSHPEVTRACAMRAANKKRFGGLRYIVLERDGYQCQKCGMTNDQHRERWGKSLTIDHIDGQGRDSVKPNNNLDNLMTLCLTCHGVKEARRLRGEKKWTLEYKRAWQRAYDYKRYRANKEKILAGHKLRRAKKKASGSDSEEVKK